MHERERVRGERVKEGVAMRFHPLTLSPPHPLILSRHMTTTTRSPLWRRWQEFRLIGQDPVLALGLIAVGAFVLLFVALPLVLVIWQGFFDPVTGAVSFKYFAQFVDPYYMAHL